MQPPSSSNLVLMLLLPLIVWRVYARFRRMVGRQRLSRIRPWITLAIFPTLVALLAYASREQPARLAWLAAGLAFGALLARYGWKKTAFETTPRGLFYTPNAHLGIALSLLFVARILYRFVEIYAIDRAGARDAADFVKSPLTLSVFGLLAGYYIAYAVGLAHWRRRVLRAKKLREAAAARATGSVR
jgi:hypothetical protein